MKRTLTKAGTAASAATLCTNCPECAISWQSGQFEKSDRTRAQSASFQQIVAPAGHDDDRKLPPSLAQNSEEFKPAHSKHVKIEQHATSGWRGYPRKEIARGRIVAYIDSEGFEDGTHRIANRVIVVYDINFPLNPKFCNRSP